jgi:hypothetical protein
MAQTNSPRVKSKPRPKSVKGLVARLSELWAEKRPGFEKRLRRGASPAALARLRKALGLKLPSELLAFYAWHDGGKDPQMDQFEGAYGWLSLDGVLATKKMVDEVYADPEIAKGWHPAWVPFLDTNGDTVCIDTRSGVVFRWYNSQNHVELLAPTFLAWLTAHVALTEALPSLDDEDPGDAFEILYDGFTGAAADRVRRKLSPGYPKTIDAAALAAR